MNNSEFKCCVFGCEGENITKFVFPDDNDRRIECLKRLNLLKSEVKSVDICLKHFEDRYIMFDKLTSDAIPSLYLQNMLNESSDEIIEVMCRTCLSKNDLISIFDVNNELKLNYSEILTYISINVNVNDTYPKQICLNCVTELVRLYNFIVLCRKTEKKLLKIEIYPDFKSDFSSDSFDYDESDFDKTDKDLDLEYIFFGNKKNTESKIETVTSQTENFIDKTYKLDHDYSLNDNSDNKEHFSFFKCDFCCKIFKSVDDIDIHISSEHNNEKNDFLCQICDTLLANNEEYTNHMDLHKDKTESNLKYTKVDISRPRNFRCTICNLKLDAQRRLDIHMRKHTGEEPYLCTFCGKTFKHEESLERHAIIHPDYKPKKPFMCKLCKRLYKNHDKLQNHIKLVHTTLPENSCFGCRNEFNSVQELENHVCNAEYKCYYCVRRFRIKKDMYEHIRLKHLKPYVCIYCREGFIVKKSLNIHYLTHDFSEENTNIIPENGFECPICEENFQNLTLFQNHEQTHTKKIYNCKECNENFYSDYLFNTHAKLKHKLALFRCKICDKPFSNICGLNTHKQSHKNSAKHLCEHCGRKFSHRKKLAAHSLTHVGIGANFACPICQKSFRARPYLSRHMRTHSGAASKRYVCQCGAKFREHSHLKRHSNTGKCKTRPKQVQDIQDFT